MSFPLTGPEDGGHHIQEALQGEVGNQQENGTHNGDGNRNQKTVALW